MSFVPECSSYCIHMANSTVGFLSCMVFYTRSKTKMVQVSRDMLLCLLMATSASLTNNLTIGLLLWAKQKRRTGLFTLNSNRSLANVFVSSHFQRIFVSFLPLILLVFSSPSAILKTIRLRHSPQTARFISERSSFSVYMLVE